MLKTARDCRDAARDLARDKGFPPHRALVIEQDAVGRMNSIRFPVIHRDPIRIKLCCGIRRTRIERRALTLWSFLHGAVKFRGRGLVEMYAPLHAQNPDGLEEPQRPETISIRRIFWCLE